VIMWCRFEGQIVRELVSKLEELAFNAFSYLEPVKKTKEGSDVRGFGNFGNGTCKRVYVTWLFGLVSARCNIYISRLCYDVSVHLSVRLSVMEVHWHIIANLCFKFRSQFTAHCGRSACGREGRDHYREEWRDHLALC